MPAQVIETMEAEAGERGKCWSEGLKQAGEAALLHARVIGVGVRRSSSGEACDRGLSCSPSLTRIRQERQTSEEGTEEANTGEVT